MERRRFLLDGAKLALYASLACTSRSFPEQSPSQTSKIIKKSPDQDTKIDIEALKSVELYLPWRRSEGPWYLLQGPHNIGNEPHGVRNAIDIAPLQIQNCQPLPEEPKRIFSNNFAVSCAPGVVETIEPYYLRLRHKNDLITGYVHLANTNLKPSDKILVGDPLGNPSCFAPPGGYTTGIHLHFQIEARTTKNGAYIYTPVPIEGFKIGGWTIVDGQNYGEGKLTKPGQQDRIASLGRTRNDIPNSPVLERP